jgi:hypothetical protein
VEQRRQINVLWHAEERGAIVRFARFVFTAAGIWGILITLPLYWLIDFIGLRSPPAVNHTEFYYGFVGVTLAWQLAFLLIGKDPHRLRLIMLPSILEKASYVLSILVLFLQHQLSVSQSLLAVTDFIWAVLFIAAFVATDSKPERPGLA